jgi:hypothetical protein
VCSVSFIVYIVLCDVLFCGMCVIRVLCLIIVPLPPTKNPFAVKVNKINNLNLLLLTGPAYFDYLRTSKAVNLALHLVTTANFTVHIFLCPLYCHM